ncbi:hypothetical protein ACWXWL_06765 [Pantoea ananatis]
MITKCCFKCGQTKILADFYRHSQMADGHLNKCKECTKRDTKANRQENIDYYKEYDRNRANLSHRVSARQSYQQTEAFRESCSRSVKRYQQRHPEVRKAHIMVGNFLRDGKLIKPDVCESCQEAKRLYAHHCDYSKPLDVMWLCHACHKNWHRHNKPVYEPFEEQR